MNKINRTRVDKIKDLMWAEDSSLPSWQKLYPDDYAKALNEIRNEILDELPDDDSMPDL
jgi:hypothetical protein